MTLIQEETKIKIITKNEFKRQGIRINLRIINKIIFTFILVSGIFYVYSANDLTIKGFELKDMRMKVRDLTEENKSLETKVLVMNSYNDLNSKVVDLKMVAVGNMDYIQEKEDELAKK